MAITCHYAHATTLTKFKHYNQVKYAYKNYTYIIAGEVEIGKTCRQFYSRLKACIRKFNTYKTKETIKF